MFRLYSKGCEYAIRSLMQFALGEGAPFRKAQDICREAGVPEPFARKMFQSLARLGYLETAPGPAGGYRLSRRAKAADLLTLIRAVDGDEAMDACVLGFSACSDRHPCALHPQWKKAKEALLPDLAAITLADLSRPARRTKRKPLA